MTIEIREILFGSAEHQSEVDLRARILRAPLGLSFTAEELAAEKNEIHIGIFADDTLIGCVLLRPLHGRVIKLRQMAIDIDYQRRGLGRRLVRQAEELASERSFAEIELHARESVISFYLSLDYIPVGPKFVEVTVPHQKMIKVL